MRTKVNGTCVDDKHRRIINRTSLSGNGIDSGYGLNGKISVTGSFDNFGTVFGMAWFGMNIQLNVPPPLGVVTSGSTRPPI